VVGSVPAPVVFVVQPLAHGRGCSIRIVLIDNLTRDVVVQSVVIYPGQGQVAILINHLGSAICIVTFGLDLCNH
jgi:hypothetical protein